jgi:serine protease Do
MHMACGRIFLSCLMVFFLGGCQGLAIEKHDIKDFPDIPENAQPAPIGFNKLRFHISTGSDIASTSPKGLFGIFVCDAPYDTMQRGIIGRTFVDDNLKNIFNETFEAQGYDVTGSPGRLFDEEEDIQRTIYSIGARVINMKMDLCDRQSPIIGFSRGYTGEGEMTIEWTVFDMLHRRSVLKTTTQGYAELNRPNQEGMQLIFENAFAAAAHNLGANEEFRNLVVYGELPNKIPETVQDINEAPMGLYDPQESVGIRNPSLSKTPAKGRLEDIAKTAVMIEAGPTHGSGFFITRQGHIITNAHVVGNALRVRVVTSAKKDKLVGEVLRVDRLRDVALIRLEEPPENISLLPIRTAQPAVGEDVYAIGAPRLKRMQDTVTKGIISAHRYDRKEHQPYLQADVDIYGGNSGGPLLDENGNIIGMSVAGYFVAGEDTLGGLNLFIPIGEALKKLDISLD